MAVIKPYEPRVSEIEQLESILNYLNQDQTDLRKKVLSELKKIRAGDAGEQRAAFLLNQLYHHRDDAVLLNGLRLETEYSAFQIDHLAINRFGIVSLFETKNFSSGLKIDDKGRFWYRLANQQYKEIPSALSQSERHAMQLQKVFTDIGFVETAFRHFVLVDYNADLEKPEKGFENVCRPDRIEEAFMSSNSGLGVVSIAKSLSRLAFGKTYSRAELISLAQRLLTLHKPAVPNYWARFGLSAPVEESPKIEMLTLSKFADACEMSKKELESKLVELGWLEWREKYLYLTEMGKKQGMLFRKGKRQGYFFLIPESLVFEFKNKTLSR